MGPAIIDPAGSDADSKSTGMLAPARLRKHLKLGTTCPLRPLAFAVDLFKRTLDPKLAAARHEPEASDPQNHAA